MTTPGAAASGSPAPAAAAARGEGGGPEGLLLAAVSAVTLVVFLPALGNDFVRYDDYRHVVLNPSYRGLGLVQLRWMFTNAVAGHYIPLTWLTYGVDYVLWGMDPFGYHLTNVLLHTTAACLFFLVALRLLLRAGLGGPAPARVGATVAALFFGIHPLRAESVAWVTERRDVLSGAFALLTVLLYLRAQERSGAGRGRLLLASVAAYVAALASKPLTMTLAPVLLLLDVYPLGRLPGRPAGWLAGPQRRVLLEKVPYFALALVTALASYRLTASFPEVIQPWPWRWRIGLVAYSLVFYLRKTLYPARLSPLYEAPERLDGLLGPFVASGVVLAVGVLGLWLARRRWPAGVTAALAYGCLLAPVTGVFPLVAQLAADRYSYLPGLSLALLVGGGAGWLAGAIERRRVGPAVGGAAAVAIALWLVALGTGTWRQVHVWRDSERLWRHAVAVVPDCGLCHLNLGNELLDRDPAAAVAHFARAAALRPGEVRLRVNLGNGLLGLGRMAEAAEQYRMVLQRYPEQLPVVVDLGIALLAMGQVDGAAEEVRRGIRAAGPGAAGYLASLVAAEPDSPVARYGLVEALRSAGRDAEAGPHLAVLERLSPELARAAAGPRGVRPGPGAGPGAPAASRPGDGAAWPIRLPAGA